MFFFQKKSIFKIFHKREQKKLWVKAVIFFCISLFLMLFFYFYIIFAPFKGFLVRLPSILGFFGSKNYLIIIQNNSERRPTGGFITAYAELRFSFGFPSIIIKDSYDIPPPKEPINPPYPLNELLSKDIFYKGFVFRDGNFSPDFPTSVKTLISLYNESTDDLKDFDGVFAIDITAIEKIIDLYGGILLDEKLLTSKNMFHFIQFNSKNIDLHKQDDLDSRKNIMRKIAPMLISKIISSPTKYSKFLLTLKDILDTKHVLLYFKNPKLKSIVSKNNWGGEFNPKSSDYIHVNVANIGGRKGDRYIKPDYQYKVLFDENNTGKANLDLNFNYTGTQGLYSDFYQAYVRVYLPQRISEVKYWGDNKSEFKIMSDLNSTSIGSLIHIWPGEIKSLHFSYLLPKDILPFDYSLDLLPMSGNFGESFKISILAKNVDNFWDSDDFETRENLAMFQNVIYKDIKLSLQLKEDITPPLIIWQKFLDKNLIEILFSEKLDTESLNIKNVFLKDLNINNKDQDDKPIILSIWQEEDYKVFLKLKNVNWQLEEHFELNMENIKDLSNNFIEPNPKKITLVQR